MKENDLPRDVIYLAEPPFAGSEGRRDNHTNNEFAERYNRSIDGETRRGGQAISACRLHPSDYGKVGYRIVCFMGSENYLALLTS
jgi:hypothetical protein